MQSQCKINTIAWLVIISRVTDSYFLINITKSWYIQFIVCRTFLKFEKTNPKKNKLQNRLDAEYLTHIFKLPVAGSSYCNMGASSSVIPNAIPSNLPEHENFYKTKSLEEQSATLQCESKTEQHIQNVLNE